MDDEDRPATGRAEDDDPPATGRAEDDDPPATGRAEREDRRPGEDLTECEREAVHEVELGLEWLQRAQGHLLQFHHATGHGMDHFDRAEELLRDCGRTDMADELRDCHLPRGVTEGDRWSYAVVEAFQEGVLADAEDFERRVRERITGGKRHVAERHQQRQWRDRVRD